MANLTDVPEWEEGIYQIEKTDRVLGGPGGPMNKQAQQLGNRTAYLKEQIEATNEALTEHKEAEDPYPQYVTQQEMTDYVGTVVVQGQVNADWNATEGAAEIKNKPGDFSGATAETAGRQGFVPVPEAGDQNKVLKGDGTWGTIASRNIGETVFSLLPLTDAGLHLLDGALLSAGGIYDAFIAHVSGLQTDYPGLFVTETEWQESIKSYGVCGKFVYTEGVSLRIPKITGFIEGTLDATALGDLVEAGLPNIKGVSNIGGNASKSALAGGALKQVRYQQNWILNGAASDTNDLAEVELDASLYNPIYGKSTTVQPQAIKGYLYMVVATSVKTDVQVNIDNVVTSLNGKAGTDLTNLSSAGKEKIANLAMPSNFAVELTIGESGQNYTMPADGFLELVAIASGSGYTNFIPQNSGPGAMLFFPSSDVAQKMVIPVRKGEIVKLNYESLNKSAQDTGLYFWYSNGSQP